jgi:hypothetical protein
MLPAERILLITSSASPTATHWKIPMTTLPDQIAAFPDDHLLFLNDAAALLGLEPLTLQSLALKKAYGLKSHVTRSRRYFRVADLRAFLIARSQSAA